MFPGTHWDSARWGQAPSHGNCSPDADGFGGSEPVAFGLTFDSAGPHLQQSLLPDTLHLPGVNGAKLRVLALSAKRDTDAVLTSRIDAQGNALSAVNEYLDNALVDEHAQLERLAFRHDDLGRFRRSRAHIGQNRGPRVVDRDHASRWCSSGPVTIAPLAEEGDARDLFGVRRAQNVQLDRRGSLRIDLGE